MLFKDVNKKADYLSKKQIEAYTKVLLKRFLGFDYEVDVVINSKDNFLYVDIAKEVCSTDSLAAYRKFVDTIGSKSEHSLFYALLEKKYNHNRYYYKFKHLVDSEDGVHVIRFRDKVKNKPKEVEEVFVKRLITF